MIEQFLNKQVIITTTFSSYSSGDSCPMHIYGKIVSYDNDFVCVEFDPNLKKNNIYLKRSVGRVLIKKRIYLYNNSFITLNHHNII